MAKKTRVYKFRDLILDEWGLPIVVIRWYVFGADGPFETMEAGRMIMAKEKANILIVT